MQDKLKLVRFIGITALLAALLLLLTPDILEARKGSGGGRSFGGSRRSASAPKQRAQTPSQQRNPSAMQQRASQNKTSFGGTRLNSSRDYTSKYGAPRKSTPANQLSGDLAGKVPNNYVVHSYGGYGSSLMTGYMLGTAGWLWMMPFHPAFYYSKPYYVENEDGTVGVYPPTFSFGKLLFAIIIIAAIIFIIRSIIRSRKRIAQTSPQSSFS